MARKINDFFLMDYVGLDAGWTGAIIIKPVDKAGLGQLRCAYETWGESGFTGTISRRTSTASTVPSNMRMAVRS